MKSITILLLLLSFYAPFTSSQFQQQGNPFGQLTSLIQPIMQMFAGMNNNQQQQPQANTFPQQAAPARPKPRPRPRPLPAAPQPPPAPENLMMRAALPNSGPRGMPGMK